MPFVSLKNSQHFQFALLIRKEREREGSREKSTDSKKFGTKTEWKETI